MPSLGRLQSRVSAFLHVRLRVIQAMRHVLKASTAMSMRYEHHNHETDSNIICVWDQTVLDVPIPEIWTVF